MVPRGSGAIVLVASTAGQRGEPFHSHYAATKGAVIALTKSLASELGPRGIRVNCVAPGWVMTDMSREAIESAAGDAVRKAIPLGRAGHARGDRRARSRSSPRTWRATSTARSSPSTAAR